MRLHCDSLLTLLLLRSTGTPQCMTRPNSCTDLSQMDKTKLCPECDKLCQLEKDGEVSSALHAESL